MDYFFEPNGVDRDLILKCAETIGKNNIKGAIIEVGTRRGGGAVTIADCLEKYDSTDRLFVCVDPYGDIDYQPNDGVVTKFDYTNRMRDATIPKLHEYLSDMGFNFMFMNMEDTEFFSRYPDGIPVYSKTKKLVNEYAFVFLDGPHAVDPILAEIEYFIPKVVKNGIMLFDDTQRYDHSKIDKVMLASGFRLFDQTKSDFEFKMAYVKE